MAFPDTDLPLMWEAAFGADPEASPGSWTFTDLTSRHLDSVVTLKDGKRAGSKTADPSAAGAVFDNDDGELTPLRALSTYWPNIKLDTPLRGKLRRADDTFTRTTSNGLGTSDTGHLWTTAGGVASAYSTTGTAASIAVSATSSDRIAVVDIEGPHQDVRITVTTNATPSGGAIDAGVVARYTNASNFYAGVANISTGGIVTAKIVKCVAGSLSTLDSVSTGLSTATSKLVRFKVTEDRLQVKIWLSGTDEPDDWDLDIIDTSLTTGNLAGIYARRLTSNTTPTTFTYDNFDTTHILHEGFTDSWKPDFIPTTDDFTSVVRVTASGPLRRLGQGAKSLRSPMFRSVSGVAEGDYVPYQYWPMEDEAGATVIASGISGGAPVTVGSGVTLASQTGLTGSLPLPDVDAGASLTFPIPDYTSTGQFVVELVHRMESAPGGRVDMVEILIAGGTLSKIVFWLDMSFGGDTWLDLYLANGTLYNTYGAVSELFETFFGNWRMVGITVGDIGGGDIGIGLFHADGLGFVSALSLVTSLAGVPGKITSVRLIGAAGMSYGHPAVYIDPQFNALVDSLANSRAMYGHTGETDIDRLARLCREQRVRFTTLPGYDGVPMGSQLLDTFMANVLDCELTGGGTIGEGNFGLTYIPRQARNNRPAGITIDLSTYEVSAGKSLPVLAPIFDDKDFRNQWEVSRPGGSSAIAADFSRVQLEYSDSATPNVETDDQLAGDASWRLALSSLETMRWPGTPVDLKANPSMIGDWLGAVCGLTRVVRTGLPAIGPDGDQDEFLEGVEHTIRRRSWELLYVGSPAKVYTNVGVYDAGFRYGASNTVLAEDLTAVETAADVTATGEVWITTASHPSKFPFDVTIGGLVYSCTAITGTTPNYTLTLARLSADKTHTAGDPVTVTDTGRYGL